MYIYFNLDLSPILFKLLESNVFQSKMKVGLTMIGIWAKLWVSLVLTWLNF